MLQLRMTQSVSREHNAALSCRFRPQRIRRDSKVAAEGKPFRGSIQSDAEFLFRELRPPNGHRLKPRLIVSSRLQTQRLKLSGDILCGEFMATGAGPAAFEGTAGQIVQVFTDC